ncbi:MAG: hypothetical protein ACT4OO_03940 [Nitrospiraceae bacterium]
MNQRRRLLNLARKGDPKAASRLFELYQVRVYTGEMVNKVNKVNRSSFSSVMHEKPSSRKTIKQGSRSRPKPSQRKVARKVTRKAARKKSNR